MAFDGADPAFFGQNDGDVLPLDKGLIGNFRDRRRGADTAQSY